MIAFDGDHTRRPFQRLCSPILEPAQSCVNMTYDPGPVPEATLPMAYDDSDTAPKPLAPASACVNMVYDPVPSRISPP
ncbi:MAG TPA: hypothetical protein VMP01_29295 [Pirellulaceae bacterium]|nr:hypothetical protein [Pirellulaceae bacterium]